MVQSVERALALLELLDAAEPEGLALSELAGRAGLKQPTTHNLVQTLEALGYACQDAASRRYGLGAKAGALGRRGYLAGALARAAEPVVRALQQAVDETVILALDRGGRRHTLLSMEGGQPLRVGAAEGVDDRLYDTATGRILLAHMAPDTLGAWVTAHGLPGDAWAGVRDLGELAAALAQVRQAGYATYDNPRAHVHAAAVSVPLGDPNVALGLYVPLARSDPERDRELVAALREAADGIAAEFERTASWTS